jgi:hypothetical protein
MSGINEYGGPILYLVSAWWTRFEAPTANLPLADLFRTLAIQEDFSEYTIEKATLESMFLKVIRENNVQEEDRQRHTLFRR